MNYRHIYHAGNFADVFKHILLIQLIHALQRKPKGFCYIDTHAGIGAYNLSTIEAHKTNEFEAGIARLWHATDLHPAIQTYVQQQQDFNRQKGCFKGLTWYAGSPCLIEQLLRPQDRMILSELRMEDVVELQQNLSVHKQIQLYHEDAYTMLKGVIPPIEKRGMILIDPAFEVRDELQHVLKALKDAYIRWQTGTYVIWYPIKSSTMIKNFHQKVMQLGIPKILCAELCVYPDDVQNRFNGSGMLIVNPPYQFLENIQAWLPQLWQLLSYEKSGRYHASWLVPESTHDKTA
jgi:23S rRNA (adenine2030-N6)-methyltransferase